MATSARCAARGMLLIADEPADLAAMSSALRDIGPGIRPETCRGLGSLEHALASFGGPGGVDIILCHTATDLPDPPEAERGLALVGAGERTEPCGGIDALTEHLMHRVPHAAIVLVLPERQPGAARSGIVAGACDVVLLNELRTDTISLHIERNAARADRRRRAYRAEMAMAARAAELERHNCRLEEQIAHLETMAWTDPLTGLANRRQIENRLSQMFAESVRYGSDLACLMIDLDGFKSVNDTLGHGCGDQLLQLVGRLLLEEARSADLAARYGGDEFILLMPRTNTAVAAGVAARLSDSFTRRAGATLPAAVPCGISIGVACVSVSRPMDGRGLIAHADNALYAAKHDGRTRIMLCGPDGVNSQALCAAA